MDYPGIFLKNSGNDVLEGVFSAVIFIFFNGLCVFLNSVFRGFIFCGLKLAKPYPKAYIYPKFDKNYGEVSIGFLRILKVISAFSCFDTV